jgi:iron(III) transport system permease protein
VTQAQLSASSLLDEGISRFPLRLQPQGRGFGSPVVLAAVVVSLLSLVPLGFVLWVAVDAGWDTVIKLVFRPRVGEFLVNTLLLELLAVPLCIALAVALAWITERSDLPGIPLWRAVAVAPLAIPAFVHSYGWISAVPSLHGLPGAVLVSVLAYSPFLYLPVAAQLRHLDPSLEDAAASLGKTPLATFRQVVLPQLRLAICGGALLVGLHLLAEYGLFAMIRFDTFATAIVDQFQSSYNSPVANLLGGVLVLCCIGLLALEALIRGGERYARVGTGAAKHSPRQILGRARLAVFLFFLLFACLAIGVPLVTVSRWLWSGGWAVWPVGEVGAAFFQTLALALGGGILAALVAAPAAWLSVRAPSRVQRLIEACHFYVGSLPGVVVALALVTITVRIALPLYQTYATLLIAYVLLFLPRAVTSLRASLAQAPVELEWAAMALGRPPLQAVWQVTARLAAPGIAAGIALVALGITNELTATLMLSPNGTRTLATQFWIKTSELDYAAAAPYALMMIVLSLPLSLLLYHRAERAAVQ